MAGRQRHRPSCPRAWCSTGALRESRTRSIAESHLATTWTARRTQCRTGLTVTDWRGIDASLRYRHIGHYILDQHVLTGGRFAPPPPLAFGLDVVDLSVSKRIRHGVDFNVAIDNLNNKRFWETQNYFVSRLPADPAAGIARVHATPGFPLGVSVGLTVRLGEHTQ